MKKWTFTALAFTALFAIAQTTTVLPKLKEGEPLPQDLFIKLNKAINPAVVNISTTYAPKIQQRDPRFRQDPFFDLFQQFMGPQQSRPAESLGTGFIIREDGLIVTNNHVIDQADVIKVQIDEKAEKLFDAKVVGRDSRTDVALLKIEAKRPLPVARLGSSGDIQVGEWVAAFGNPFGHGHTMTKGIISAVGREIDEINIAPFLQTDASINPGNSGGPLVNSQGLVIGVNTAIDQRAQGIGFAIPIDYVKSILPALEKDGGVKRGFIGIQMGEIDEEVMAYMNLKSKDGAFVLQVVPGSPAERSGIKEYDVVIELDGQKIKSWREVSKVVARANIGQEVTAKILRGGKTVTAKIKIGAQPDEMRAEAPLKKRFDGQKAPFDLGFKVVDYNPSLGQEFGIPPLRKPGPVVIEVTPESDAAMAGLAPGDVILDVNMVPVAKAKDLLKALTDKGKNVLRVLKRDRVVLMQLPASK